MILLQVKHNILDNSWTNPIKWIKSNYGFQYLKIQTFFLLRKFKRFNTFKFYNSLYFKLYDILSKTEAEPRFTAFFFLDQSILTRDF